MMAVRERKIWMWWCDEHGLLDHLEVSNTDNNKGIDTRCTACGRPVYRMRAVAMTTGVREELRKKEYRH
jgi:hypothetical protein